MGEGIDGFGGGLLDDQHPLVGEKLEMLAGIFLHVGGGGDDN